MMNDDRLAKPPPPPSFGIDTDAWTCPFWDAAAAHRLVFARCAACHTFRMPPTPFCPQCRSQEVDWVEPPGDPVLYSYTIVERAVAAAVAVDVPYVPAVVEYPDAGHARLVTNIVGSPLSEIKIGERVILGWHDVDKALSLPIYSMPVEHADSLTTRLTHGGIR